jgi:hypothetical protein
MRTSESGGKEENISEVRNYFDERNFLVQLERLRHPHFGRWGIISASTKYALNKQQTFFNRAMVWPSECEPELLGSNLVVAGFFWFSNFFVISIFIIY